MTVIIVIDVYYLAAQKPVPPRRVTVTCGWWKACKLFRVLCWRVIWAPCLAGILAQQLFVLMQYGAVTCRLMGKNKVERCRELSDIVRRRQPWEAALDSRVILPALGHAARGFLKLLFLTVESKIHLLSCWMSAPWQCARPALRSGDAVSKVWEGHTHSLSDWI